MITVGNGRAGNRSVQRSVRQHFAVFAVVVEGVAEAIVAVQRIAASNFFALVIASVERSIGSGVGGIAALNGLALVVVVVQRKAGAAVSGVATLNSSVGGAAIVVAQRS